MYNSVFNFCPFFKGGANVYKYFIPGVKGTTSNGGVSLKLIQEGGQGESKKSKVKRRKAKGKSKKVKVKSNVISTRNEERSVTLNRIAE